jgi:hypothetical protein
MFHPSLNRECIENAKIPFALQPRELWRSWRLGVSNEQLKSTIQ